MANSKPGAEGFSVRRNCASWNLAGESPESARAMSSAMETAMGACWGPAAERQGDEATREARRSGRIEKKGFGRQSGTSIVIPPRRAEPECGTEQQKQEHTFSGRAAR